MPEEPTVKGLSYSRRQTLFWFLVIVFIVALPSLIFYTTGYRLTFENDQTAIVTTGGMYVTTNDLEVDVYLDEEWIEQPRLFQSAYYIQNINAGQHRLVVQRPDLQTWVKALPVDAHIVTEAASFNMPVVPQLRPVTEYTGDDDEPVVFTLSTSTELFPGATSTVPVLRASTTAARIAFTLNPEYIFVESLFSTSSLQSVFDDGIERFRFATTGPDVATATIPIAEEGDMLLAPRAGELYATWQGSSNDTPYYFCVYGTASSSIADRYGTHVAEAVERHEASTTTPITVVNDRLCRPEIRIDRKQQDVFFFDFFPNSRDIVILQLEDGVYVTEIDDRAWQNTQLLYPGQDLAVVVENDSIFVRDDEQYFEIITEIELP